MLGEILAQRAGRLAQFDGDQRELRRRPVELPERRGLQFHPVRAHLLQPRADARARLDGACLQRERLDKIQQRPVTDLPHAIASPVQAGLDGARTIEYGFGNLAIAQEGQPLLPHLDLIERIAIAFEASEDGRELIDDGQGGA